MENECWTVSQETVTGQLVKLASFSKGEWATAWAKQISSEYEHVTFRVEKYEHGEPVFYVGQWKNGDTPRRGR